MTSLMSSAALTVRADSTRARSSAAAVVESRAFMAWFSSVSVRILSTCSLTILASSGWLISGLCCFTCDSMRRMRWVQ